MEGGKTMIRSHRFHFQFISALLISCVSLQAGSISSPLTVNTESLSDTRFFQNQQGQMFGMQTAVHSIFPNQKSGIDFFVYSPTAKPETIANGLGGILSDNGQAHLYGDAYAIHLHHESPTETWTTAIGTGRQIQMGRQTLSSPPGGTFIGVTAPNASQINFSEIPKIGAMNPTGTGLFLKNEAAKPVQYFEQIGGAWKPGFFDASSARQTIAPTVKENFLLVPETAKNAPSSNDFFKDYFPGAVVDQIKRSNPIGVTIGNPATGEVTRNSLAEFYRQTDPFKAGGPALQGYLLSEGADYRETYDGKSQIIKPSYNYPAESGINRQNLTAAGYDLNQKNPDSWNIHQQQYERTHSGAITAVDRLSIFNDDRTAYRSQQSDGEANKIQIEFQLKKKIEPNEALKNNWANQAQAIAVEQNTFSDLDAAKKQIQQTLNHAKPEYDRTRLVNSETHQSLHAQSNTIQKSLDYRLSPDAEGFLAGKGEMRDNTLKNAGSELDRSGEKINLNGWRIAEYANAAPAGTQLEMRKAKENLRQSATALEKSAGLMENFSERFQDALSGYVRPEERKGLLSATHNISDGFLSLSQSASFSGSKTSEYFESKANLMNSFPELAGETIFHPDRQNRALQLKSYGNNVAANLSLTGKTIAEESNHPLKALQVVYGVPFSFLSGDILDKQKPFHFDAQGPAVVFINGIRTTDAESSEMKSRAQEAFNAEKSVSVENNTHLKGIGDAVQIIGHEFGALDISAIHAKDALREAIRTRGEVQAVAHSQGTAVFYQGAKLLEPEERSKISYQGFGAQRYVDGEKLGLQFARNVRYEKDPVPVVNDLLKVTGMRPLHQEWERLPQEPTLKGNNHSFDPYYYSHVLNPDRPDSSSRIVKDR